jgi:hypothetical protein
MPRVENRGANVRAWCDATGEGSTTLDVCTPCHTILTRTPHAFSAVLISYPRHTGEPVGVDGWGGEVDHPSYDDRLDGPYRCAACNVLLIEKMDA